MGIWPGSNVTLKFSDENGNEIRRISGGRFAQFFSSRRPIKPRSADPVLGSEDWLTDILVADTQEKLEAMTPTQSMFALTSASSRMVTVQWHIGDQRGRQERCLTMCSSLDPSTPTVADEVTVLPETTNMDVNHPGFAQWVQGASR